MKRCVKRNCCCYVVSCNCSLYSQPRKVCVISATRLLLHAGNAPVCPTHRPDVEPTDIHAGGVMLYSHQVLFAHNTCTWSKALHCGANDLCIMTGWQVLSYRHAVGEVGRNTARLGIACSVPTIVRCQQPPSALNLLKERKKKERKKEKKWKK